MQAEQIWEETVAKLKAYVKHPTYQAFVKQSTPISLEEGKLVVNAPNDFARNWIDSNYTPIIKEILREVTGEELLITFIVQTPTGKKNEKKSAKDHKNALQTTLLDYIEEKPKNDTSSSKTGKEEPDIQSADLFTSTEIDNNTPLLQTLNNAVNKNGNSHTTANNKDDSKNDDLSSYSVLNPKYKFNTFVVGEGNRIVHAAALKIAETPGKAYNPLFMYGGVGLGKTHLMQAIGHALLEQTEGKAKIVYINSEQFVNDLVNAIKNYQMAEFRNRYRKVDLLLIDDIQFIGDKERIQVEFFHTFNSLYEAGKQIVLTSDRLPKEIAYLEDRLRNRFEMGLIADMHPPDLETRIAILKKKTEIEGYFIDINILHFIASSFHSNVRELEGALTRIIANVSIEKNPLTLAEVQILLQKELPQEASPTIIVNIVAEHFHLESEDILGKKQTKDIVLARQIAMYLIKDYTNCSLRRIANIFNKPDHSPVKNAIKNIETTMELNPTLRNEVQKIKSKIIKK